METYTNIETLSKEIKTFEDLKDKFLLVSGEIEKGLHSIEALTRFSSCDELNEIIKTKVNG